MGIPLAIKLSRSGGKKEKRDTYGFGHTHTHMHTFENGQKTGMTHQKPNK